jgi:hypothetical protein
MSKSDIVIKCGDNIFNLNPNVYSFIVNAYYDGVLRDVYCDKTLRGRLWGAINLDYFKGWERFP